MTLDAIPPAFVIILLYGPVLLYWPARVICRRAGLPLGFAWLACLPAVGLLVFASVLAFRPWPGVVAPPRPKPRRAKRDLAAVVGGGR